MRLLSTKLQRVAVAAAISAGVLSGSIAAGSPASADYAICAKGHVCITDDTKLFEKKIYDWYYYGAYNLSNQYGYKRLYNEQTGGAVVRFYSGYNGTGTVLRTIYPDPNGHNLWAVNLTPVNSVVLAPR